jgi:small conductance mechanosensitive channel
MKQLSQYLSSILLSFALASAGMAQAPPATDDPDELAGLVAALDQNINQLRTLGAQIEFATEIDREAMVFRRDQRSFDLLQDLDALARRTAELPAEDPTRVEVERRLREDLAAASDGIFTRVDELGARIAEHTQVRESLSGGQRIAHEAYINSLQGMRLEYYAAMADIIDGRKALDMETAQIAENLQQRVILQAETLVGRIEFSGAALDELRERLQQDPANADLDTTVNAFDNVHRLYLARLETLVDLMSRLDVDGSIYKEVLLQQGQSLSITDIEGDVLVGLLRDGWSVLSEALRENAPDMLFNVVVFLLILLGFRAFSRLVKRAIGAACDRPGVDISNLLRNVLISVSGGTVMAFGILMALSQVGISLGPMLAGLGVAGFVVGFALQDTLGNFAAGGMILIYRPYDVDDFVEVTGASGLVKKMSLVSTTITTFDNQTLVVPNSRIWGDVIKNVTAQKVRRVDLEFGIGYSDDIDQTERVLEDILDKHEMVLKKPEPLIKLHTLGDSSVNFVVRPWVKTEDYWDVYWDLTREVKMRFDQEGISIPFPQRDVHLYQEPG